MVPLCSFNVRLGPGTASQLAGPSCLMLYATSMLSYLCCFVKGEFSVNRAARRFPRLVKANTIVAGLWLRGKTAGKELPPPVWKAIRRYLGLVSRGSTRTPTVPGVIRAASSACRVERSDWTHYLSRQRSHRGRCSTAGITTTPGWRRAAPSRIKPSAQPTSD